MSVTNGSITQNYSYDASGNVNATSLSGSSGSTLNSSATYTGSNNRILSITDSAGNTITYGYSAGNSSMWGLSTSITDGKGVTVTQAYDKFGRLTNTSLANTASLAYNYSNGNLTSVTRTNTTNSSQQTYTMGYDGFGNMTSIKVGNRNLATYAYGTRNGLLNSMTMANGEVFSYDYDFLGRQIAQTNSSGTGISTSYTADGQISSQTEIGYAAPLTWRYTYDSLGRQIASVVSIPGGTFLQTQQSYNDKNQLTSKNWKMWAQNYGESYTYNSDGSLNTVATASGANLQYNYDHLRRVRSITSNLWGTMPFYTKTYSYKDLSSTQTTTQVSSIAYSNVVTPITFGYTYDAVGNVLTHSQTGEGTITYTYDNQGQLLKAAGDTTYTYTYDNVGNILTASNGTTTHTYTYGDANWKDLLTKFDGVSITYDASGNPLAYYNGTNWTYTWAAGRRLMSATGGGNTVTFSYNEDGSRASKTVNGTRHNYTWDGQTLVRDYYGNTILDFSYDANGQPYAMYYNSTPYFYILNLQGDVIRMVDGNGNTVASYEYDPYGRVISATGSMADINPLRYLGYYYDQETKLYHLWSRYYDPQTGRFINADEYSSTSQGITGYNMFSYCGNNPISRADDGGKFWNIVIGAVVGGVVSGVISLATQVIENKGFNNINWGSVGIAAASGAVSGAFAATGIPVTGQTVINATIGIFSSVADTYVEKGKDATASDYLSSAVTGGIIGAVGGFLGGNGTGTKHLSRSAGRLVNKVGTSLSNVLDDGVKATGKSIVKAGKYYYSQVAKQAIQCGNKAIIPILVSNLPNATYNMLEAIN